MEGILKKYRKNRIKQSGIIVVPSLSIGQETVDILDVREDNIEIIPYIGFVPGKGDRRILHQLSIS